MMISGEREALAEGRFKITTLHYDDHLYNTPEARHLEVVNSHFLAHLEKDNVNRHVYMITKIDHVINPSLQKRFRSAQDDMTEKPTFAYHGTPEENVYSICEEGFRMPGHTAFKEENDVGWYGHGIYLTEYPRFAMNYMQHSKKLLMCKVLRGKVYKYEQLALGKPLQPGYDSHEDPYGKEIIIFDSDRILPCYIIHFEIRDRFKKKSDSYDPNEEDDTELKYLSEMEMHKGETIPEY